MLVKLQVISKTHKMGDVHANAALVNGEPVQDRLWAPGVDGQDG